MVCYLVFPYAIIYTSAASFQLVTNPGIYFVEREIECWHEDLTFSCRSLSHSKLTLV
jgi:hypothetical protein